MKSTLVAVVAVAAVMFCAWLLIDYESYSSLYDASYVGAAKCGECHTQIYPEWRRSPHANMTRRATVDTVVGNFDNHQWSTEEQQYGATPGSDPVARMYREGDTHYMALRHPHSGEFVPFPIEYAIGYQYRQVYLTREAGGVLRRLPLQWSTERDNFFSYWNFQEKSPVTAEDLWSQMGSQNSAWNLFCARCHTTKLVVADKNDAHTRATTAWVDNGIACEACHGPGSQHVNYMAGNPVNRVAAWVNSKLRDQPVAYIANASKLTKGQAMSVCARCHGSDIFLKSTDIYRLYEPGYSKEGRINDLSAHFTEGPIPPGRTFPTLEVWDHGVPKGIGMLFRTFIESSCYENAEPRCYQCHNPHDNKMPAQPGLLAASQPSNDYCLGCHVEEIPDPALHTRHTEGTAGSFCYDCHMPKNIMVAATGITRFTRSHNMSSVPDPQASAIYGADRAPNACNDCHQDQSARWSATWMQQWWPGSVVAVDPDI
ncbi:MAG: hypothetical protein HKN49_03950 [Gammaproteobacteria bacterium]|nr:hypothetical protein [Gammaproteobacteria bacterium]